MRQESKQLEQPLLIIIAYSDATILYRYFYETCLILSSHFDQYPDITNLGKLECIRLEPKQHLHESLLVCLDVWVIIQHALIFYLEL